MLHRTTVLLPVNLKARAVKAASEKGVSFGELIRMALEFHLMKKKEVSDPFFEDNEFFEGKIPSDLAKNHDNYLYEE